MLKRQEKLTVAAVVSRPGAAGKIGRLESLASEIAHDWELLLVARRLPASDVIELTRAAAAMPDTTLHLLEERTSEEAAQLAALDMAIGDRVMLVNLDAIDEAACRRMVELADAGHEVVLGRRGEARRPPLAYRISRAVFARLYRALTGVTIERELPRTWLYSRSSALHLLSRREAEMLLRSTSLGEAFPTAVVDLAPKPQTPSGSGCGMSRAMLRAYRALNFTGALPLRLVVFLSAISAIVNLAYMAYVVLSHFLEEVAPGWTTLSLQISGMFFLISIILGIIAEHVIAVDRAVNRRPRYTVLREVRSPLSKSWRRRNIVGVEN